MNNLPLVSVITPTFKRHDLLINRCIPSVCKQTYPRIQHIIVSDGYDASLESKLWNKFIDYDFIAKKSANAARRRGLVMSRGELIVHLDDDDAYRKNHISALVRAFAENPGIQWAYTDMVQHFPDREDKIIGSDPPEYRGIGTPMIMHRRELADTAFFGSESRSDDWNMVKQWLDAGAKYVHVPIVTVDVWPAKAWKDLLMNELELAGLKRKYHATQELAKRAELRAELVRAGVDPDAAEPVSVAPKGRSAPVRVTAAPTTPRAKAAVAPAAPESKETSKETADKTVVRRRTVGRSRKTENTKEKE